MFATASAKMSPLYPCESMWYRDDDGDAHLRMTPGLLDRLIAVLGVGDVISNDARVIATKLGTTIVTVETDGHPCTVYNLISMGGASEESPRPPEPGPITGDDLRRVLAQTRETLKSEFTQRLAAFMMRCATEGKPSVRLSLAECMYRETVVEFLQHACAELTLSLYLRDMATDSQSSVVIYFDNPAHGSKRPVMESTAVRAPLLFGPLFCTHA